VNEKYEFSIQFKTKAANKRKEKKEEPIPILSFVLFSLFNNSRSSLVVYYFLNSLHWLLVHSHQGLEELEVFHLIKTRERKRNNKLIKENNEQIQQVGKDGKLT
jgi:hypothetical protein